MTSSQVEDLVNRLRTGDRAALARLLTQVENNTRAGKQALNLVYRQTGRAHLVGITGAPGTGKSTLVNQLALSFRRETPPRRVAVVAVDPSSPFSGGAVLGDRVRMRDLVGDPGVFIRSMASRGALGGLAEATAGVTQLFDAAGFDLILIETVGAGQAEVDIARLAHTTIVVEAPGLGDEIQVMKAGVLEIADILAVNKADLPGAENVEKALKMMVEMAQPARKTAGLGGSQTHQPDHLPAEAAASTEGSEEWAPPVVLTIANLGTGMDLLHEAVLQHRGYLDRSGGWKNRETTRVTNHLDRLLQAALMERWRQSVTPQEYQEAVLDLVNRRAAPEQTVNRLLRSTEKAWSRIDLVDE